MVIHNQELDHSISSDSLASASETAGKKNMNGKACRFKKEKTKQKVGRNIHCNI